MTRSKKLNRITPEALLYILLAVMKTRAKEIKRSAVTSKTFSLKSILRGATKEAEPKTIVIFATLLPIIFPILISALLFFAATILTISSGRLVPNEIKNIPIIHSDIQNPLAIFVALSIAKSAPKITKANPTPKKRLVLPQANFSFIKSVSISPSSSLLSLAKNRI